MEPRSTLDERFDPLVYSKNWLILRQFIDTITEFVTVTETTTTTSTILSTIMFTYAGCTPDGATLCPMVVG